MKTKYRNEEKKYITLFNVKHGVYARMLRKLMEITSVRTQALHEFHFQKITYSFGGDV